MQAKTRNMEWKEVVMLEVFPGKFMPTSSRLNIFCKM